MTIVALLFVILIIGVVAMMQTRFQQTNLDHAIHMKTLQSDIIKLLDDQKELNQKVELVDDFDKKFKNSREQLSKEIVAFQYELLNKVSNPAS